MADVADHPVGEVARPGCVEISSYWKHWICLFPQHGRGPKHTRPISLSAWQEKLVAQLPHEFLAGLIHSDGCRCSNRVKGRAYPRYFFSNRSADIRRLFVTVRALVGVESRPDGPWNISVAKRASVVILDGFVGPKR